ncbi:MAG: hypothetical protein WCD16_07535 [Paracoccaceae bacterium]
MADDGLTEKDIKKMQKELKQVQSFFKQIEKMGGEIPKPLKKSVNRLKIAIDTGKDIGDAANEAGKALKEYEKNLKTACKTVDREMRGVCEARIDRKWMARNVTFTLSYKNPDSVTSRSIKKTVQRYTPALICKHWDYCAKKDKKTAAK